MLSPLPRHSDWAYYFAHSPSRVSLPRYGSQVGLCIVLFEACSAFTRVTACTLALPPIRGTHSEGFSYFVTSIAAPVASGWSSCREGLTPAGKRRLARAHATDRRLRMSVATAAFLESGHRGPTSQRLAATLLNLPIHAHNALGTPASSTMCRSGLKHGNGRNRWR